MGQHILKIDVCGKPLVANGWKVWSASGRYRSLLTQLTSPSQGELVLGHLNIPDGGAVAASTPIGDELHAIARDFEYHVQFVRIHIEIKSQ